MEKSGNLLTLEVESYFLFLLAGV